ncbi:BRCA1-associated RING domain protein 1-like [Plodia interpunctella]|uniref:BRCA1-associated RING domain protein 1-like n=1 Tax=Plodia interpunctella TaxID=58824 RepID=UPI00236791F2|nr:BRCA1-associated RING domain protein 1-like [Plodia interpunctella]
MYGENLKAFLTALDVVKQDYICGFCGELCKDPITLSKCFHMICSQHFSILRNCPVCNVSLEGCNTFSDHRVEKCIESAKELDVIFKNMKSDELGSAKEPTKKGNASKTISKSTKESKNVEKVTRKASKNILSDKTNQATKNEMDSSFVSSLSTKATEKRNQKGETLLHIACRFGKMDKVMELLSNGANTNTKDYAGWTPLHEVVQNGNLDLVILLLQYNAMVNVPGQSNETPLHEAVRYNHVDIVKELVRNGADINSRNCKGETPMQLASDDMKKVLLDAANDVVHTQTVNVTLMSELYSKLDYEDIRVYCSSEQRKIINKLKLLAKHHSNLNIEFKFTKKVTHIIVDSDDNGICTSSIDILLGIVSSVWILSAQWVLKSTEEKLEPFEKYEVAGVGSKTYNGPKNSRYNKYKQLPGLFNGCHIYLHNFNTKYEITKSIIVTKAILTKLIMDAGGIVLRRVPNPESIPESEKLVPYHARKDGKLSNCAHYIVFKDIYEPMYNMNHLKALPVGWLIECIEKYELCEPLAYSYV